MAQRAMRTASRDPKETRSPVESTLSRTCGERPAADSSTAVEHPNQIAASARAKVVAAIPCPTDAQLAAVIGAAACLPKTKTTRIARTGA